MSVSAFHLSLVGGRGDSGWEIEVSGIQCTWVLHKYHLIKDSKWYHHTEPLSWDGDRIYAARDLSESGMCLTWQCLVTTQDSKRARQGHCPPHAWSVTQPMVQLGQVFWGLS